MNSHEPLQITAYLRSPVISDEWLPLDGLLLYQMTRRVLGPREFTLSGYSSLEQPKGMEMIGRLPLSKVHGKEWYYRCSWAQWGPCVEGKDYWNKRFDFGFADLIDFRQRRGAVIIDRGPYKFYHQPVFYRSALWIRWYCLGNKKEIEDLLGVTTHIGKKTVQGWGRVIRWSVESIEADYSIWRDGKLMRGIPPSEGAGKKMAFYGIRPPYWDRRNQTMLVIP